MFMNGFMGASTASWKILGRQVSNQDEDAL